MSQPEKRQDALEHTVICYVGSDGLTVLRCPTCGTTKSIDTNKIKSVIKTFKAKCKCGASITGRFEFRRYYRKKVKLFGSFYNRKTGVEGKMIVENISLMGVGFRCFSKHNWQKGDHLDIIFSLDNPNKSVVKLWVEVANVQDKFIGTKRCDTQIEQPDLGFYLR